MRHEEVAAFMASAYGKLTGNTAVCIGVFGPGATNLVTGLADAHLDHDVPRAPRPEKTWENTQLVATT